jgi:hypothetical protein
VDFRITELADKIFYNFTAISRYIIPPGEKVELTDGEKHNISLVLSISEEYEAQL